MSNTQTKNVPELRFPGFEGEWEEKKLEDIGTLKNGINKDKESFGYGFPFVNLNDVFNSKEIQIKNLSLINSTYKEREEYNLQKGDTLFIRSSVKPSGVGLTKVIEIDLKNVVFSGFLIRFRNNNLAVNFKKFIFNSISVRKQILSLSSTSANTNINQESLKKVKIPIPCMDEQQKIGRFFSKLDRQIELEEQKLELIQQQKKGYMQKIFSQELRFKDENGKDYPNWEEKQLGEVADRVIRKNKNLESKKPLTISGQLGLIDQTEYFSKSVSSKNLGNYTLIKNGEFAYNKSYSNGYPLGAIKRLTRYESGLLSSLYICFSIKSEMSKDFMEAYFDSTHWYREVSGIAVEGARNHGLLNISVNDFFNILTKYPSLEEQQKIGSFFSKFDRQIELEQKKIELLQQRKKDLLKSVFI
ncbi:TPA: restriction endonuclease subunit S [Staphylococcus aureus]|uniref:restriction endonuclease subunit S n=1 Tax=Staphylococcus aureus TaxID=1280 RepID=UPI001C1F0107|nr:restriction endonuclease subunit S [Staphylococcus aureus]MBU6899025.1 restriction endonuclease subunit S [Staphylococcus aureus]HCX2121808.1 restriction endonuclease subunit S [Staphylococcus aureus]HDH4186178.1 restriction endonuclease subunit S [Staphylococcus aureus]HDI5068570.1 restriction endonuclease subunit S [Staphylococcus aureus]